jgi:transposase
MVTLFAFWREVLMPWKASSVMEERLRFVARLLDGEATTELCRDFGVSRKTGYKIFHRYKEHGLAALTDRSRRPVRYANQLPLPVESLIVRLKGEKPHWGARVDMPTLEKLAPEFAATFWTTLRSPRTTITLVTVELSFERSAILLRCS